MPATSRFRVSLGGLADAEHAALRHLLQDGGLNAAPQWDVADDACQAVVVDPDAEAAGSVLGGRPFGSLVILVLRPGETAWPGTLSLARPFDARQVDLTLNLAAQIIAQPAFSVQAPASTFDLDETSAELEESVEASTQEAPLFEAAVQEAAAIEESQAIEQAEAEAAEIADADANAIEATVAEADDDALDRLALAALGNTPAADDADDTEDDPAPLTDEVVELHAVATDRPVDLLTFPSPDDIDPLDIAFARVEKPEMFGEARETPADPEGDDDLVTSLDAAASDLIEFDRIESGGHDDRPGPFDDLIAERDDATPVFIAPMPVPEAAAEPERMAEAELTVPPEPGASPEPVAPSAGTVATPLASEEMPEPTVALADVDSLVALATAYREQLYRARHVVVSLGDDTFHLEPYTGAYHSTSSPESLARWRGQDRLAVAIDTRDEPAGNRPGEALRLVDFLWHLGFHAGQGELLPWVDGEARYRIARQPPMGDDAKETGVLQIAQLLSSSPVAAPDIARLAGASETTVNDFLNGASLVGYLERVATPLRRAPRAAGARSRAGQASLIGNLRKRIGLPE